MTNPLTPTARIEDYASIYRAGFVEGWHEGHKAAPTCSSPWASDVSDAWALSEAKQHATALLSAPSPEPGEARACECGHAESEHETIEYRGTDKPRWCQSRPCRCRRFVPAALKAHPSPDVSPERRIVVNILRRAGCRCEMPLVGERPDVGPRCRLCNVVAMSPSPDVEAVIKEVEAMVLDNLGGGVSLQSEVMAGRVAAHLRRRLLGET